MKLLAAILLPVFCLAGAAPSVDALIESTRNVPPEFAADALIRLAALDSVAESRKVELLQHAFDLAGAAQEPYKRRAAIARFGGPAGFLNRVYSQDLDGLSLRLRTVSAMLAVDRQKATVLFQRIPALQLPAVSCNEFMVPDVGRFYQVLESLLAAETLTPKDLERFAGNVHSAAEIPGIARAIAAARLSDADFGRAVAALTAALGKVSGDDRTFTHYAAAGRQIELLAEECRKRKISATPLVEVFRAFLVWHLSGKRCADDELQMPVGAIASFATPEEADAQAADAANFFNQHLAVSPVKPIEDVETMPARQSGNAQGLHACEDTACKGIANEFHELVFHPNGNALQPKEKDTPEWHAQLLAFLKLLAEWTQMPEVTPAAYFREKCGVYNDLAGAVPSPAERELVLQALLDFVGRNSFQVKNRLEWFLPVNGLIGRAALDPVGLARITELLRKSSDPVIALFANLEVVAPRTPDKILPLL